MNAMTVTGNAVRGVCVWGLCALAFAGLWLAAAPAGAKETPIDFAARVAKEVLHVLAQPISLAEKHDRLNQHLLRYADLSGMAKALAGPAYGRASQSERVAYEGQFARYIYESYIRRARHYNGEKLTFTKSYRLQDGRASVGSRLKLSGKTTVAVTWFLSHTGEGWRLYDVRFAAFSLLSLKKGYFKTLLRRRANRLSGLSEELAAQTARRQAENDRYLLTKRPKVTVQPLPEKQ